MDNTLNRRIAIVGAASSIGIRPYDDEKEARHLDRAPAVLRELGIVNRLGAEDLVRSHSLGLADHVAKYADYLD